MSDRLKEPSLDRMCYKRIEVEFEIPVYLTADQVEMLHYIVKEICSDPQNTPAESVHEIASHGPKPMFDWRNKELISSGKITAGWDEDTLYFGSSVR